MSSRKRMNLKKNPDFPIIGDLTHRILLLANPKTKFHKYIPIQKEQIVPVYIQKQKTRMRAYIIFLKYFSERIWAPAKTKRLSVFFKKTSKGQLRSSTSVGASLRTHKHMNCVVALICRALAAFEVPHNHPNLRSPFYQESEIF